MTITIPRPLLALGAGYLLLGPIDAADPTNTVTGGVFTDDWPVEYDIVGATDAGHVFKYAISTTAIMAAEFDDPISTEVDSRNGSATFSFMEISASNYEKAFNGGTKTVTGTGATTLTKYTPPKPGEEVRRKLGWESRDHTERLVVPQVFQTGEVSITRNRGGANRALIPVTFSFEVPADGSDPFAHYFAGTDRG